MSMLSAIQYAREEVLHIVKAFISMLKIYAEIRWIQLLSINTNQGLQRSKTKQHHYFI